MRNLQHGAMMPNDLLLVRRASEYFEKVGKGTKQHWSLQLAWSLHTTMTELANMDTTLTEAKAKFVFECEQNVFTRLRDNVFRSYVDTVHDRNVVIDGIHSLVFFGLGFLGLRFYYCLVFFGLINILWSFFWG